MKRIYKKKLKTFKFLINLYLKIIIYLLFFLIIQFTFKLIQHSFPINILRIMLAIYITKIKSIPIIIKKRRLK